MCTRYIEENVKRRIYAESMGRCMNPNCRRELFCKTGDIIEKAHIDPYCETANNTFENLVVLCPNCHKDFDKNHAFTPEEILNWKKIRRQELEMFFGKKFTNFEELKHEVVPLLLENKSIYENYYLKDNRQLWDKFENKILVNNNKLKLLFSANLKLIQQNESNVYSNLSYIQTFLMHINEFEATRCSEEKNREILFPKEINSMFGITPIEGEFIPATESLELLIEELKSQGKFETIVLGIPHPYIQIKEEGKTIQIFIDDTPRIRQFYYDYKCFRKAKVRFESLNYALKYIRSRGVDFAFLNDSNLREICICDKKMIFVYEYCLGQANLLQLMPEENSIIVNLHNWNGNSCISKQAYESANSMKVKLLTMEGFYEYIREIKKRYY